MAGPGAGAEGRPERPVHRARRHRLRPARLLRQPDRDAELRRAGRRAGCGTTTCTPPRCARRVAVVHHHRPQPPQQRDGVPSPSWRPAIPATTAIMPFENGFLSEMLLEHGYNTYMVGKWHLTPSNQETAAGPYDRWPLGPRLRALLRLPRWRHQPVVSRPRLRQPPGRAAEDARGGLPPHRGPGRQGDRVHRRRQAGRPGQAVLPAPVLRRDARPAPRAPRSGPTGTRARSTTAGTPTASRSSPGRRSSASCPPTPSCRATIPTCRSGTRCRADARRLSARMMEVFAGFLTHTDHHIGRLLDFLREHRRARQHADHGHLRQRRQRRGRTDRHDQRGAVLQQRPGADRGEPGAASTRSAAPSTSTTTRGAGPGPATRRSGAGSGRPTAAASSDPFLVHWPQGITARGEVRTQYAHIIDMVPTVLDLLGHRAARRPSAASPRRRCTGVSFAHTLDDADAASRHHTQYFEMLGHRAIYHDGWRAVCPWPGPSFAEAGIGVRRRRSPPRRSRELDANGWELYHVAEDFAENHNVAAEHRDKLIAMIATWYVEAGKYDVMPVDGSGLARMIAEKPLVAPPRDQLHVPARHPVGPVLRRAPGAQPPAQHHRRRRDPRRRRRGRAAVPGHRRRRLLLLRQGRQAPLRPQLRRPRAVYGVVVRRPMPAGRHELRFEFEPTGEPDMPQRQGRARDGSSSTSTAPSSARPTCPSRRPFMFNPGALTCGANPGSPVTPTTRARSVHRHHRTGDRRRQRRPHRGPRGRVAGAHGAAVGAIGYSAPDAKSIA